MKEHKEASRYAMHGGQRTSEAISVEQTKSFGIEFRKTTIDLFTTRKFSGPEK